MGRRDEVPIPKLTARSLRRPPGLKPSVGFDVLRLAILLSMGAIACWLLVVFAGNLTYALGWAGTPVTLTQVSCADGNTSGDCYAVPEPASPGRSGLLVSVTGSIELPLGRTYPARLHADNEEATLTEARSVEGAVAGVALFLALIVLLFGVAALWLAPLIARKRRWSIWEPGKLLRYSPLVLAAFFGLVSGICAIIAANTPL